MTGLSVNTNLAALTALRFYQSNAERLGDVRNRVSTGLRVAGALDDASSFSIAQGVRGDIKGWQAISASLAAAHGTLTVALAAATQISDMLGELNKKAIEYFVADTARQPIIQNDINALIDNIDTVASSARYNGVNLLGTDQVSTVAPQPAGEGSTFTLVSSGSQVINLGTYSGFLRVDFLRTGGTGGGQMRLIYNGSVVSSDPFNAGQPAGTLTFSYSATPSTSITVDLQGSPNPIVDFQFYLDTDPISGITGDYRVLSDLNGQTIDIQTRSMLAADLNLDPFNLASVDTAFSQIESATRETNANLGYFGTKLRDVTRALEAANRFSDALTEGLGSLVDADLERESAVLTAAQVRQDLSLETLALVNQRPRVILDLMSFASPADETAPPMIAVI
jgi:flagellin